jgi:cytochrome c oxidase assembly factor CtaG
MRRALSFLFRLPQGSLLWQPIFVWAVFAATLWSWHHAMTYEAALRDPLLHDAQHLSLFVAACLFWRICLDPTAARRLSAPAVIPYLFTTAAHTAVLGVFLALAPRPWYGHYLDRTAAWGLSPLEDQQLAGLIMWMPACLIFPAVSAILFGIWLNRLPQIPWNPR